MSKRKEEEKRKLAEAERNRLMTLSKKELLVEILLTLRGINETNEGIAIFSAMDAFR